MDEEFRKFLKRGGRSDNAIIQVEKFVREFEDYLQTHRDTSLRTVTEEDLQAFVDWVECEPKTSAKKPLWGLIYYFEYAKKEELQQLARFLRRERIKRKPFLLKDFRGIDPQDAEELASIGIRNTNQMLQAGKTESDRKILADKSGLPYDTILELVKLSDLARIPGIKGIRARLYLDAGIDTVEMMSHLKTEEMLILVTEFVERTGFDGIPPLPAEVRYSIAKARSLPKLVAY